MKPAFAYYGGKQRHAPWIVEHLPEHRVYVEPFAGSAAVLLAKEQVRHEVLNDLDGNVINFYRVLRDQPDDLAVACSLTPYSRGEYLDCADIEGTDDPVERARRWWCRSTQAFGQSATRGTGWSISTAISNPRYYALTKKVDRFAGLAERLRHVYIENKDAFDVIAKFAPDADAVLYVDPPYEGSTRAAPSCYTYDFPEAEQHVALAQALKTANAAVVLSGYDSPLYTDLYAGWHRHERPTTKWAGHGRSSDGPSKAVEVLWVKP